MSKPILAQRAPVDETLTPEALSANPLPVSVSDAIRNLSVDFVPNVGQADASADFVARDEDQLLSFKSGEVELVLVQPQAVAPASEIATDPLATPTPYDPEMLSTDSKAAVPAVVATVQIQFAGADVKVQPVGQDVLPGIVNYYVGDDPANWRTNVQTYSKLAYLNLYSGVDLIYERQSGTLKSTFVVHPGATADVIHLTYAGVVGIDLDANGDLLVHTSAGDIRELAPVAYQDVDGQQVKVPVSFKISGNEVEFAVLGKYDPAYDLVIDPTLTYSTFLGDPDQDLGYGIKVDSGGNIIVAGTSDFSGSGTSDAWVRKVRSDGAALLYSTFFVGSNIDRARGLDIDDINNAYVVGITNSTNFPVLGAYQGYNRGGYDVFLAKINPQGGVEYSSYFGGSQDDIAWGMDRQNGLSQSIPLYVVGQTFSTNFPKKSAYQPNNKGASDAFVFKIHATGNFLDYLDYSTYLGGSGNDIARRVVIDENGSAYITGEAEDGFPPVNAYQSSYAGGVDVFVAKLDPTGGVDYSTYLGGGGGDHGYGIAIDSLHQVYVVGTTASDPTDTIQFPLRNNLFHFQGGTYDAFYASLVRGGYDLRFSTYFGGSGEQDQARAIVVDATTGSAYITGTTSATNFANSYRLYVTGDADQRLPGSGVLDSFVTQFDLSGTSISYSTYLGGQADEIGYGIDFKNDGIYVTGGTSSTNFHLVSPLTGLLRGGQDTFVSVFTPPNPPTPTPPLPTPVVPPPCTPTPLPPASKIMNVYVVAYTASSLVPDPNAPKPQLNPVGWAYEYSKCLSQELTVGTIYHGYQNPSDPPYMNWNLIDGPTNFVHAINRSVPYYCGELDGSGQPLCGLANHSTFKADYGQVFNDITNTLGYDICFHIRQGDVQEVWLWADGGAQFAEHLSAGPYYEEGETGPHRLPNCDGPSSPNLREFTVMGFNFSPGTPFYNAMESYQHHVEYSLFALFPCEFAVPKSYWTDPQGVVGQPAIKDDCASSSGFSARARNDTEIAQCGLSHWPPNVTRDDQTGPLKIREYNGYQETGLALNTGCVGWNPDPNKPEAPTIISGTCQDPLAWSCIGSKYADKLKFHRWWLQNVPGPNNGIKKCDQNGTGNPPLLGNWWDYLRGDFPPPGKTYCSPLPVNVSLSGLVSAGPLSGATITLYTLEQGGALLPVSLSGTTTTAADGTYTTPALPVSVNGKTLVIQATGGSFLDEATGQTVSFSGQSLYSVIPQVDLDRPLSGVVTTFTDIAFRLAKRALIIDHTKRPDKEARYQNFWVADIFGMQVNTDNSAPSSDHPISITEVRPVNFYAGQKPLWAGPDSGYALALAGLSQQAANASLSPAIWIGQLSADADDGVLNGPVVTSVQTLQSAINIYTEGPRSPLGATFTVTKTTDTNDGSCDAQDCSLREAIIAANLTGGLDTIVLSAGTYTLTRSGSDNNSNNGDLDLTTEITLTGAGANKTTIAGGTGWTDRIFEVITTTVQVSGLTIQGGNKTSSDGGAIYSNNSTLTLSNVAIKNNTANNGGGIYLILGSATLLNSSVTGNIANGTGGGIRNAGGTLTLINTTLSGNTAKTDGGGLHSANNGSFVGTTSLTNVTITNNTADSDGNGTGEGGGLYRSSGTVALKNTLIAGNVDNSSATKHPDCSGSITSQGNNLIGNNTGCSFTPASGDQVGTGSNPINPQLGALQDNGGQTFTHALLSNSPAKDAGSNTDCPTTDQRGIFRPQGTTCDIGAYEAAAVLDNFNRANGAIGSNWSGNVGGYVIASNRLDVFSNGDIYWKNTSFGANQEAFVTLTTIDTAAQEIDLMLKSQSNTAWSSGGAARLEVWYDPDPNPANSRVRVVTYTSTQGWVQRGTDIPVSFANGDVFSARATADGRVMVYRNGALLATRDVTAWPYYASGGYIGLWTINASNALLDDFGGGGVNEQ